MVAELKKCGLSVEREKVIKIWYDSNVVGRHRLDLVVDKAAIVEPKAMRGIIKVNMAQMNSYLHETDYPLDSS